MKFKNILLICSLLLVTLMCMSSVVAYDNDINSTDGSLWLDTQSDEQLSLENNVENELSQYEDSLLSTPKTIIVEEVEKDHNEMNEPTIQTAIDGANAGDTIIINGESYQHCHFIVNKQLTIKSNIGTTMGVCSSTAYSGYRGIFYITSGGSGTVIEGFTINNEVNNANDYGILVSGASNVIIKDCKITNKRTSSDAIRIENSQNVLVENVTAYKSENGIRIKNSQNVNVTESSISGSKYGVMIVDSTNTRIFSNDISGNTIAGIAVAGNSAYSTILSNNISNGNIGVNLTSADHVDILNNYIAFNSRYGVYVNCNITQMNIRGNFINQNAQYDIFNDHRVRNLFVPGGEQIQVITNNYMIGHAERPVWRQVYEYRPGEYVADYTYDPVTDEYTYVGDGNGDYYGHQSGTFLGFLFEINQMLACPNIFFYYPTDGVTPWTKTGNYKLQLSDITQVRKGTYTISIVDENGTIAQDLSSVPVTFYLNKADNQPIPKEGDVYKIVYMKNGTATVSFTTENYQETGNVLLASFPGIGNNIYSNKNRPYKTLDISDNNIPGDQAETRITVSDLNTYPKSNDLFTAVLSDVDGNFIADQSLTFNINSKNYTAITDREGKASIKVYESNEGSYPITVYYAGDDDYDSSSAQASVVVKKMTVEIISSDVNMVPGMAENYSVTLIDECNQTIANQNVVFTVNKKSYTVKTNANGVASQELSFATEGTYSIVSKFAGSAQYGSTSNINEINVQYSSKETILTVPAVTIPPNTDRIYTISLKNELGEGISDQSVTIKVNGKTYNEITDDNGQVNLNVNLPSIKSYGVRASYDGNMIYKSASASGTIKVVKAVTVLESYDRTFAKDSDKAYSVILKDDSGYALVDEEIIFKYDGKSVTKTTDSDGIATVNLDSTLKSFDIESVHEENDRYTSASSTNRITISDKTGVVFVDDGLPNSEIQRILDSCKNGDNVEFLGNNYTDVALNVTKPLNIYSQNRAILNAKSNNPVFKITASNVVISNFTIIADSYDAIEIANARKVIIQDNIITNVWDESQSADYLSGEVPIPGYGVNISASKNIQILNNDISLFESGIYMEDVLYAVITGNTIRENNYGIKYGFGVSNTRIANNTIINSIGLYTMEVPEGPSGYGIFLNNSAVNVTITRNVITWNHMGISIDANYSTNIVITSNWISDSVLEGIRFNEGYDLAENAVEPKVTNNAIYRNARGPSMMILGELSANPAGIYGPGVFNDSLKLKLNPNWYGKNQIITWDNDTGIVGYGTMCPRIKTTPIAFNEIECETPGTYSITFYKNGKVASALPRFDMYATLNNETEVVFDVVNGVGTFSFDIDDFDLTYNEIQVSIGSLTDQDRIFKAEMTKILNSSEIPTFSGGVSPSVVGHGDDAIINVTMLTNTINGNIWFTISDENKTKILTDKIHIENGSAIRTISNLDAGKYYLHLYYAGNSRYHAQTVKGSFEVVMKTPIDSVNVSNWTPNEDVTVKVKMNGVNGNVWYTVSDENNTKIVTDKIHIEDGWAITSLPAIKVGKYRLHVYYAGNAHYAAQSVDMDFEVTKISPEMVVYKTIVDDNVVLTANIAKDARGNVNFAVNGNTYKAQIVKGVATVTLSGLAHGSYTLKTSYGGNYKYLPETQTRTIVV
ncbi:hypothetical protein TL18_03605 [Methanobrevibacter sp. YE315]|uniref:right-handed parallel beta-helix repeat-containing protein n=1 Tax=Methanobrevibacter sp. YE315 TaxID=1609968 RepID=UPI000764DC47|nr:Ig-like domain repeat protein [Methanobrevibacter sp. YE315]AMD17186.1 hypothetical protein TL18_03605 [Methanobrevibacter sp. YE315]